MDANRAGLLLAFAMLAGQAAAAGDTSFTYDKNGNLTSQTRDGITTQYVYDVPNRLVEARRGDSILVRFQYDADGRVIKRIGVQGVRQYIYDGQQVIGEYNEDGSLVASYVWGNARLVSITRPGQSVLFPQHDALGSVVALTNEQGAVVARYHYDAWGSLRFPEEMAADPNRYGFTGHRWDEEIGLHSAPARRFDPVVGRFTTQDSYLGEPNDPFSLHRYLYGNANPTRYTDPTGHWSWEGIAEGVTNLPRAIAEPALWVYDTALVIGAKRMGISSDHIELQSALGRRQQQRIEEGQTPAVAATKGAIEAPAAVLSFGTTSVVQGHYELARAFAKGEISIDEYDRQLSQMAGASMGGAAVGMGASRVAGRTWTGRTQAPGSTKAQVVVEGPHGDGVLVPAEGAPVAADLAPEPLARVAGGSQAADALVHEAASATRGYGDHGVNLLEPKPLQPAPAGVRFGPPRGGGGSAADRAYAGRVSGGAEKATYVNGTEFDAVRGGVLIDAKRASGSGSFYDISGTDRFTQNVKIPEILAQARRQVSAIEGAGFQRIRWEIADPVIAGQLKRLFRQQNIPITVVHTPPGQ
jgi:RHS repeat-associated protein